MKLLSAFSISQNVSVEDPGALILGLELFPFLCAISPKQPSRQMGPQPVVEVILHKTPSLSWVSLLLTFALYQPNLFGQDMGVLR